MNDFVQSPLPYTDAPFKPILEAIPSYINYAAQYLISYNDQKAATLLLDTADHMLATCRTLLPTQFNIGGCNYTEYSGSLDDLDAWADQIRSLLKNADEVDKLNDIAHPPNT